MSMLHYFKLLTNPRLSFLLFTCGLLCSEETAAQISVKGILTNVINHVLEPYVPDGVRVQ